MRIRDIIRIILTIPLLYWAYTETGPWTCACLTLIFMECELNNYLRKPDAKKASAKAFLDSITHRP